MYRFFFCCLTLSGIDRQPEDTAQEQEDLADQQTGEISTDSGGWDEQEDPGDPYTET